MVSRERRADVFCTSISEVAKLETGSMSKEVKTHMTGANDIVSCKRIARAGYRPMRELGGVVRRAPHGSISALVNQRRMF